MRFKDPVCGMMVEENSRHFHYQNSNYYFCSDYCLKRFQSNPQSLLQKHEDVVESCCASRGTSAKLADKVKGATYTCPMHPEIETSVPDICPKCGMALEIKGIPEIEDFSEYKDMKKRLIISLFFSFPLMIIAMKDVLMAFGIHLYINRNESIWIQFILSTVVIVYCAKPIFQRAFISFKNQSLNMFSLIGMGSSIAYIFSVMSGFFPETLPQQYQSDMPFVFFEATSMIISFVLLGQVLELKARSKTNESIKMLMGLQAKTSRKLTDDGEIEIEIDAIQLNDKLIVKPGDKIAVDGIIVEGSSLIDESQFSGEAIPVFKTIKSEVKAGTIALDGTFIMRVTRHAHESYLAKIIDFVAVAQRSRAPIQKTVDRISAYFIPLVMAVAILTSLIWLVFGPEPKLINGIVSAIAVLIIACPCALGLATPLSVMIAMGQAALKGALIKDAESLETLSRVNTIVLDKTGTLTTGKIQVVKMLTINAFSENEVLQYALDCESKSQHPIASAIVSEARKKGLRAEKINTFKTISGKGLIASKNDTQIKIGTKKFIFEDSQGNLDIFDSFLNDDAMEVFMTINNKPAAIFYLNDSIKERLPDMINKLKGDDYDLIILSGDSEKNVKRIAETLSIKHYYAELMPNDKAEIIKRLKLDSKKVIAMLGDGINDAPALAVSDLGIAMGNGTDIAMETASAILLNGDISSLLSLIHLSKKSIKNINENIRLAFGYNLLAIPIAAGLFYPLFGIVLSPMIAAAAMSVSSVSVVLNALRLRNA